MNGGVECWGSNEYGQLGNNSTTNSPVPVPVSGLTSGVTAITAGADHTCAIVHGGVQCWGYNQYGQLGNHRQCSGLSTCTSLVPAPVTGLTSGVTAITAKGNQACALANGGVQCWGDDFLGQLGGTIPTTTCGSSICSLVPLQVSGLTSGVTAISAGVSQTCALVNGGEECWGYDAWGQLGASTTTTCPSAEPSYATCSLAPLQVTGLTSDVRAIAEGANFGCAIVNGGIECWGINEYGELGTNATTQCDWGAAGSGDTYPCSLVPVQVTGLRVVP